MATYSEEEKARILSYPIEDLLSVLGKRTDHRRDMYFSPFRDETQPSLHISRSRNLWKDFGDNTGGNVLTMASRLLGISTAKAWDYIAGLSPDLVASGPVIGAARRSPEPRHRIIIDSVSERFIRRQIVEYAKTRGIPLDLLSRYCSEVTYHIEGSQGLHYTAIGFLTDGASTMKLFCVYRSSLRELLTYPRFFTHVLGHSNFAHYSGNITLMLVLGPTLEERYGSRTLLKAIVITAFISGLLQWALFPNTALLGASGIVFAFILLASFTSVDEGEIPLTFILVAVLYIGQQIWQGITSADNISQFAHIIGGIVGSVLGFLLRNTKTAGHADLL